jgi:hypothetical protein
LAGSGVSNYALSFGGYTGSSTYVSEAFVEAYPYLGAQVVSEQVALKFITSMRVFLVTSSGLYYNLSLDRTAMTAFQTSCGTIISSGDFTYLGTTCLNFLKTFSFKRGTSTELVTFPSSAETAFLSACTSYIGHSWDSIVEDFFTEVYFLLITGTAGSFNFVY